MPFRSEHEHRLILQALQDRNPVAARQAMADHLDEVIRIFSRGGV
jgi:DNA-binding GntR family transcriptional regulator